jgi:prefoldin subunit 5
MKEEIRQLRQEIAALEKEQKNMKAQRKTVNLKVERTIDPFSASEAVKRNREQLRVMYAAYGVLRGKTFEQIENSYDRVNNQIHPLYGYGSDINKILNKYGYEMEHEEEEMWYGKRQVFKKGCDEKIIYTGK